AAFFGLGLGFDDNLGLLGLGRCFQGRAPLRFHALGLGQRRFGEGMVLRFLNRSFGLALARLALLVGFGLLDLQLRLGEGDAGLGLVFTLDGPGVGLRQGNAHFPLGILDLGFAFEGRGLFAHFLFFV